MSVLLPFTAAMLFAIGTYLVLQRKLSRVIVGVGLLGHGANILLIIAGRRGASPLVGRGDADSFADPVPQALALTAIVISFGVTALLLAFAYRSWLLSHDDEIPDDLEDRAVARHEAPVVIELPETVGEGEGSDEISIGAVGAVPGSDRATDPASRGREHRAGGPDLQTPGHEGS